MLEGQYKKYIQEIDNELKTNTFSMEDKTLVFFANSLGDCDIFLLLLTASIRSKNKSLYLMNLNKYSSLINYSNRNCMRSFTRLVAMGLIKEHRGAKNTVSYTITQNGDEVLDIVGTFLNVNPQVIKLGEKIGFLINKEENVNE